MWLLPSFRDFISLFGVVSSMFATFFNDSKGIQFAYTFPASDIEKMETIYRNEFPKDFLFGVATSAYQTEGAWNASGKGESIWDRMIHENPDFIRDRTNGDVATDTYHKFKEDIQLAKSMGCKMFRFSLSWPRILPDGRAHTPNLDGIRYYNEFIDELISNGIEPMVTLFHWDLPYKLHELGGFTNPLIVEYLTDYAEIAFTAFGDKIKYWATIHEPVTFCLNGYGGDQLFPSLNQSGIAEYICAHNVLLAHASIYGLYQEQFRSRQNGKVGIILELHAFEPENVNSLEDREASEIAFQWWNGWFFNPLFSESGDYPTFMKNEIAIRSILQAYRSSRLPAFTEEEILSIRKSTDFVGINYYAVSAVRSMVSIEIVNDTILPQEQDTSSFVKDAGAMPLPVKWTEQSLLRTPWTFTEHLIRVSNDYNLPPIIITANGYKDNGHTEEDIERTAYYYQHIAQVLKAMQRGLDIRGYLTWSLLDSFEWTSGYTEKFGLFKVDFRSEDLPRTPKLSSKLVSDIYKTKTMRNIENVVNTTQLQRLKDLISPYETKT